MKTWKLSNDDVHNDTIIVVECQSTCKKKGAILERAYSLVVSGVLKRWALKLEYCICQLPAWFSYFDYILNFSY